MHAEGQWSMMRRTGVVAAMIRLLVAIANRAAQRPDISPSREEAAVLAALVAALSRLCRSPELREAMATPELVQHAVFLLHTPIVDTTKAGIIAMLNIFVRLSDDPQLRESIVSEEVELGPVLAQQFLQTTIESGEDIIKHSANALVPFVSLDGNLHAPHARIHLETEEAHTRVHVQRTRLRRSCCWSTERSSTPSICSPRVGPSLPSGGRPWRFLHCSTP
jgi:hypothetical protein